MRKQRRLRVTSWTVWAVFFCLAGTAVAQMVDNTTEPYGTFNGVDYVIHKGRLEGTTSSGPYRVPYHIVAPADPSQSNGRVIVEPSHFAQYLAGRDGQMTPRLLFREGYVHAGIGWSFMFRSILDLSASDVFLSAFQDPEIIVQFAWALRTDPLAGALLGDVEALYAYGYSQTTVPLHLILHSPWGQGLFDLTILQATGRFALGPGPHVPPAGAGKILVLQTEADLLLWEGARFRGDDDLYPNYRVYEIAGAPHIPDEPHARATLEGLGLPPLRGTTPLVWTPVVRALLAFGNDWVSRGVSPPSSTLLDFDDSGAIDPVYPFLGATGIARDENLNALGGVRMPDVEIGRGQYVAADFVVLPQYGTWTDLACEPLSDGSDRFGNHGQYVSSFEHAARQLVRDRFLLVADFERMVSRAARSKVGKPGSCN